MWPWIWKQEFVTSIPKTSVPQGLNDLRNISYTMLPSKIHESYILNWVQDEVKVKENQFGGVKGYGTLHLLISMWEEVTRGLKDDRASIVLTSIDYGRLIQRGREKVMKKCLVK